MKILFILSRFPYPLEKGDKLRAWQHLLNLKTSGHEVHLVALSDLAVREKELGKIRPLTKSIHVLPLSVINIVKNLTASFFRKLPLQAGYFYSEHNREKIDRIISEIQPDLVYCQLIRTANYIKNQHHLPLVIDFQDAFSKGTLQRTEAAPWWIKFLFERELRLVKILEQQSNDWFDAGIIISEQDKLSLASDTKTKIKVIPNGVDTDYFVRRDAVKKFDVTFVGNMNYPPNVDAALFLVEDIMPLVWKQLPGTTVQIAGASPNSKVRSLASNLVTITGWVDDIRDCYANSKIFIAPMRMGTGLQNKLLEAMAMGIPCVTTTLSFDPLGAASGIDMLVGNYPQELADRIAQLLKNESLRNEIGNNGLQFVKTKYSMEHSRKLLDEVMTQAVANYTRRKSVAS